MACPEDDRLGAALEGGLPRDERDQVLRHVEACAACRAIADELRELEAMLDGSLGTHPATASVAWARLAEAVFETDDPVRFGRYQVVGRLGRGAMGVVYRANDPELDRDVALKVLADDAASPAARARMLREAKAMARLRHPNVVEVYDVGVLDEQAFIAMELVEGTTLRGWVRLRERHWRETIATFVAAGRGLEAAHRAGLVHRDFKPDNVLVGNDGRSRVTDFGLVRRTLGSEAGPLTSTSLDSAGTSGGIEPLSRTGPWIGTPAYMAPEQLAGLRATASSDQYAFCVALYEALCGRRPFDAPTAEALAERVRNDPPPPLPVRAAPRSVRIAIQRGLSTEPRERFDSVGELLEALQRKRRAGLALVAGGATLATAVLVLPDEPRAAAERCSSGPRLVEAVWAPLTVDALRQRTLARPDGEASWAKFETGINGFVRTWTEHYEQACAATTEEGEPADLRLRCLRGRLSHLEHLLDGLRDAKDPPLRDALAHLPVLERCAELEALPAFSDPRQADAVESLRSELSDLETRRLFNDYSQSLEEIDDVVARAEATGYAPVIAEAMLYAAQNERYGTRERRMLEGAVANAQAAGYDRIAAYAATKYLHHLLGDGSVSEEDARTWYRHADAAVQRLDDPSARARLEYTWAAFANARAEYDVALERLDEIQRQLPDSIPSDDPVRIMIANGQAISLQRLGRPGDALRPLARAIEAAESADPPNLLAVAQTRHMRGTCYRYLDRPDEALAEYEAAIDFFRTAGGNDLTLSYALQNYAGVLDVVKRDEDSENSYREALEIRQAILEPDDTRIAMSHVGLAVVAIRRGALDVADEHSAKAVGIFERTVGLADQGATQVIETRARLLRKAEQWDEAEAFARNLLTVFDEAEVSPDAPRRGLAHVELGHALDALGYPGEAKSAFERALAILDKHKDLSPRETSWRNAVRRALDPDAQAEPAPNR